MAEYRVKLFSIGGQGERRIRHMDGTFTSFSVRKVLAESPAEAIASYNRHLSNIGSMLVATEAQLAEGSTR